jgi:hypothetical protein
MRWPNAEFVITGMQCLKLFRVLTHETKNESSYTLITSIYRNDRVSIIMLNSPCPNPAAIFHADLFSDPFGKRLTFPSRH